MLFVNEVEEKMKEEKVKYYGWERGEGSEKKVFEVLEELKTEGIIKNCGRSFQFGMEDLSGVDIVMITLEDKVIYLQVKSSSNPVEKEKYRRRGIYYLGGVREKNPREIKQEILEILRQKSKGGKNRTKNLIRPPGGGFLLRKMFQNDIFNIYGINFP